MRTRTYLTTPPGHVPTLDATRDGVVERYVPGLAAPHEPAPRHRPNRRRAVVAVLAVVVATVALLLAIQPADDPSMGAPSGPAAAPSTP